MIKQLRKELKKQRRLEDKLKEARAMRDELKRKSEDFVDLYKRKAVNPVIGQQYRVKPLGFTGELIELKGKTAVLKVGKQRIEVPLESLFEV